jgi:hypothetical protein
MTIHTMWPKDRNTAKPAQADDARRDTVITLKRFSPENSVKNHTRKSYAKEAPENTCKKTRQIMPKLLSKIECDKLSIVSICGVPQFSRADVREKHSSLRATPEPLDKPKTQEGRLRNKLHHIHRECTQRMHLVRKRCRAN